MTPSGGWVLPLDTLGQLSSVLRGVVVTQRSGDQPVVDRPFLVAGDANRLAGTARPGVRAGKRPVKLDARAVDGEIVAVDLHVRQGRVEALSGCGNGVPSNRRSAIVYRERAIGRELRHD